LALIWMSGDKKFPPNLVRAYKWASLAAEGDGVWSELGKDLRSELELHTSAGEQIDGKKQADLWKEEHSQKSGPSALATGNIVVPPIQPTGPRLAPKAQGGCTPPGWPGPPLPCTDQLPTIPGQLPPP